MNQIAFSFYGSIFLQRIVFHLVTMIQSIDPIPDWIKETANGLTVTVLLGIMLYVAVKYIKTQEKRHNEEIKEKEEEIKQLNKEIKEILKNDND